MSTIRDPDRAVPARLWISILAPPCLWYAQQQAITELTKFVCAAAGSLLTTIAGAIASILCLAAAALAWRDHRDPYHRFMVLLGVGSGGVFALVVAFQTLACVLLPPCVR
jgi:hypothetical protein